MIERCYIVSEIHTENLLQTEKEILESTETVDSGTEIVEETNDGTEVVESTQAGTETLVADPADNDTLLSIADDVHLILVFTIITFVMACFRGWRKNTLKGV